MAEGVTDGQARAVVLEACDFLEHQSFNATIVPGADYGDRERQYLIGWRDGYLRAIALLRSVAAIVVVPDDLSGMVIDG